jgi:hypothetical protein
MPKFSAYTELTTGVNNTADFLLISDGGATSKKVNMTTLMLAPPAIGPTTPGTGAFTTLDATTDITLRGTTGGLVKKFSEATANIEADASTTIEVNIPAVSRILGVQLRVDAALTDGETWDAAYSGGSTESICTGQAVAKSTKVNSLASAVVTSETDIAITKNGGGSFTAAGTIRAIVYYETFDNMADAS